MKQINNTIMLKCNASLQIGSGHVMRCLTLATELFHRGINIVFFTNDGGKQVIDRFATIPIQIELIDQMINELDQLKAYLDKYNVGYLIWDSYDIKADQECLISTWIPMMVIDDTNLLPSYSCNAILNQNVYANPEAYRLSNSDTLVLAGSQFAMLRDSFRQMMNETKAIREAVEKVLITFGGSDQENLTLKVLEMLQDYKESNLEIDVVLGAHYSFGESIRKFVSMNVNHQVNIHENITSMAQLMWDQDFVFTASGSTMYELAVLGIPSCCMVTADNQVKVAQAFAEQGATLFVGDANHLDFRGVLDVFRNMVHNYAAREEMSLAGKKIVDGHGVGRVADVIEARMNARAHT